MYRIKQFLLTSILFSILSNANATGTVSISPDIWEDSYILGADYNVRYAPAPGHENSYVSISYNTGGTLSVFAYSANDGMSFYCTYSPSSYFYDDMLQVAKGVSPNGAHIGIERYSNYCFDVHVIKESDEQY